MKFYSLCGVLICLASLVNVCLLLSFQGVRPIVWLELIFNLVIFINGIFPFFRPIEKRIDWSILFVVILYVFYIPFDVQIWRVQSSFFELIITFNMYLLFAVILGMSLLRASEFLKGYFWIFGFLCFLGGFACFATLSYVNERYKIEFLETFPKNESDKVWCYWSHSSMAYLMLYENGNTQKKLWDTEKLDFSDETRKVAWVNVLERVHILIYTAYLFTALFLFLSLSILKKQLKKGGIIVDDIYHYKDREAKKIKSSFWFRYLLLKQYIEVDNPMVHRLGGAIRVCFVVFFLVFFINLVLVVFQYQIQIGHLFWD